MNYIVTNFVYGFGPFLRTTEMALALNDELARRGQERFGIIVPWIYGDKQKQIMLEEFSVHADEIYLDITLGKILSSIFYDQNTYQDTLRLWLDNFGRRSDETKKYLSGQMTVETLNGRQFAVDGHDIMMEISRSPRLRYGVAPNYAVTFGHISEILERTLEIPIKKIAVDRKLVERAATLAQDLEGEIKLICLSEPGTFSCLLNRTPRYSSEIAVPPTINVPPPNQESLTRGIYVTVTGIPGLERLHREVQKLGLKLYSNDPTKVPGSIKLSPRALTNPNIVAHFARSGWGSVWLSQLVGIPLVAPPFDPIDDPEIYFNNICIERLGLGIVYQNQPLDELITAAEALRATIQAQNEKLLQKFGTLNGAAYCAKLITDYMGI